MASYTEYKHLEKPLSTEKYNVGVFNKNNDIIDTEFHKLELKNESQDALLATKESVNRHTDDRENPHNVSKAQIGLGNADNTADLDKPVSTAQRAAINDVYIRTSAYTDTKTANLVDDAPENHNTLKKLSDALNEQQIGLPGEILKSKEAVSANTNENNLVSAIVVGELIDDLNAMPQYIYDETGKIIGYKTSGNADIMFPFSNAGYILSGTVISIQHTAAASTSSYAYLPLKNIRHLRFNYSFTNYYESANITLVGPNGSKTVAASSGGYNGANYSGTYDQDLNEEYDYLSAYIKPKTNHAYSKLTVSNVVATA